MRLIHTFRPDTQEVCFTLIFSDVEWRDACSALSAEDADLMQATLMPLGHDVPVSEVLKALMRMAESVEPISPVGLPPGEQPDP